MKYLFIIILSLLSNIVLGQVETTTIPTDLDSISVVFQGEGQQKGFWKYDGKIVVGSMTPHWKVEENMTFLFVDPKQFRDYMRDKGYRPVSIKDNIRKFVKR